MDNLAHEFPLDTALAAAHLFCVSSDAAIVRKMNRLAVLVATTFQEAGSRLPAAECLATSALITLLQHLQSLPNIQHGTVSSVHSGENRSVTTLTPALMHQTGISEHPSHSPRPSLATQPSALSATWGSSPCFTQTWKSVAEMRRLSAQDCDLHAAPDGQTPTSRYCCSADDGPLSPLQEEATIKGLGLAPAAAAAAAAVAAAAGRFAPDSFRSSDHQEESTSQQLQRHHPTPPISK
jgi:hypothetical protein